MRRAKQRSSSPGPKGPGDPIWQREGRRKLGHPDRARKARDRVMTLFWGLSAQRHREPLDRDSRLAARGAGEEARDFEPRFRAPPAKMGSRTPPAAWGPERDPSPRHALDGEEEHAARTQAARRGG